MAKVDVEFKTEIGVVEGDTAAVTISINNHVVIHEVQIDIPGDRPYPAGWQKQVGALAMADMMMNGPSVAGEPDEHKAEEPPAAPEPKSKTEPDPDTTEQAKEPTAAETGPDEATDDGPPEPKSKGSKSES